MVREGLGNGWGKGSGIGLGIEWVGKGLENG